ncbi:MAG: hypothetical protein KGM99_05060 [Burkholderiales bacterium]|nr:hypothetical protein [Burkholderiales bacterium]
MATSKNTPRVPHTVDGIQVNYCKNALCANFGIEAREKLPRTKKAGSSETYRIAGDDGQVRVLICLLCRRTSIIKSNLAIAQELLRFNLKNYRRIEAACSNEQCKFFGCSQARHPAQYYAHGTTKSGEPRFRCRSCGSTFSCGAQIRKQRRAELNAAILKLLVNKVPMRRMCEILAITPSTLYSKINYLYEVTSEYSNQSESKLQKEALAHSRAYISVDRQDHTLNWGTQFDRRNTILGALGAVENISGYVLAMQLNFDADLNAEDVEADAIARGDYTLPPAFRHYARVWLRRDYEAKLDDATVKDHQVDLLESVDPGIKAPQSGMQVHLEYLQSALFFHLKAMLKGVERLRFCLDRDPGMDTACMAAFANEIKQRKVDVFLLKNLKDASMAKKKTIISSANRELDKFRKKMGLTGNCRSELVLERLKEFQRTPDRDPWFQYPLADMAEPNKAILYLTDFGDYDIDHLSRLYMRITMRGIDRFFMQVRRRLSLMERPIASPSSKKMWHGYSAYSPLVATQVLTIFRVYYNYCMVGEDKKTPAMRFGLAKKPISLDELATPIQSKV